jgi:HPt (histidine-containing phosphotransfer) domain-containing protein
MVDELSIEDLELRLKNHATQDRNDVLQQSTDNAGLRQETANISTEQSKDAEEFDSEFFNREQALSYWKTESKLKSYLVRFKSEYQSVDEQLKTLDPVAAEQLAHKLKGASAVLGLPAISHKAKALMDVYNSPILGDVDLLIDELKTILDETWRFIDQYTE